MKLMIDKSLHLLQICIQWIVAMGKYLSRTILLQTFNDTETIYIEN